MDRGIRDAVVGAARLAAGKALRGDAARCAASAPPLAPGTKAGRCGADLERRRCRPAAGTIVWGPWPQAPLGLSALKSVRRGRLPATYRCASRRSPCGRCSRVADCIVDELVWGTLGEETDRLG